MGASISISMNTVIDRNSSAQFPGIAVHSQQKLIPRGVELLIINLSQSDHQIHHIGACRTRRNQITARFQKVAAIAAL